MTSMFFSPSDWQSITFRLAAATIWLAAGLGAAAGCGLWQMSLIGTFFALVVLSGVKKLKKSSLSHLGAKNRLKKPVKDAAPSQDLNS